MNRWVAGLLVVVYIGVGVHLADLVREACWHGNCKSGRYSQFNGPEKAARAAWLIGFPLVVGAFVFWRARSKPGQTGELPGAGARQREAQHEATAQWQADEARRTQNDPERQRPADGTPTPLCLKCGGEMSLRIAQHGRNAGRYFYGCNDYPACSGIRQVHRLS